MSDKKSIYIARNASSETYSAFSQKPVKTDDGQFKSPKDGRFLFCMFVPEFEAIFDLKLDPGDCRKGFLRFGPSEPLPLDLIDGQNYSREEIEKRILIWERRKTRTESEK